VADPGSDYNMLAPLIRHVLSSQYCRRSALYKLLCMYVTVWLRRHGVIGVVKFYRHAFGRFQEIY